VVTGSSASIKLKKLISTFSLETLKRNQSKSN